MSLTGGATVDVVPPAGEELEEESGGRLDEQDLERAHHADERRDRLRRFRKSGSQERQQWTTGANDTRVRGVAVKGAASFLASSQPPGHRPSERLDDRQDIAFGLTPRAFSSAISQRRHIQSEPGVLVVSCSFRSFSQESVVLVVFVVAVVPRRRRLRHGTKAQQGVRQLPRIR